jgi:hypothetical protein
MASSDASENVNGSAVRIILTLVLFAVSIEPGS